MMGSIQVIINADDFGMTESVNRAITESFERGFITSTTMMANLDGFDDAIAQAVTHSFTDKIGLHVTLTQGKPLTRGIAQNQKFCDEEGSFFGKRTPKRIRKRLVLTKTDRKHLRDEVRAQIERLRTHGITPTHIDSHHHIHTEWVVGQEIIRLAAEYGITKMRVAPAKPKSL